MLHTAAHEASKGHEMPEQHLYLSWGSTARRTAAGWITVIPLLLLVGLREGWPWIVGGIALGALLFVLLTPKELVVDSSGVRYVPLLALRRMPPLRWDDVADITTDSSSKVTCSGPSGKKKPFYAMWAAERGGQALAAQELADLLNRWRVPAHPESDSAARTATPEQPAV